MTRSVLVVEGSKADVVAIRRLINAGSAETSNIILHSDRHDPRMPDGYARLRSLLDRYLTRARQEREAGADPRSPRVTRHWAQRRGDSRPKRVRDYRAECDVEAVHPSSPYSCAAGVDACPGHGVIPPRSAMVRVHHLTDVRRVGKVRVPETSEYHPGCVPGHLAEAVGMLSW